MEVKKRAIGDGWAYACPRCLNGTMSWEHDKAGTLPYLKCVLCGQEIRQREKFEKTGKKVPTGHKFEREIAVEAENKGNKTENKRVKKWVFGKKVQNC